MNVDQARAKLETMLDSDMVIEWLLSADERAAIEALLDRDMDCERRYWAGHAAGRAAALAEVQALLDARAA